MVGPFEIADIGHYTKHTHPSIRNETRSSTGARSTTASTSLRGWDCVPRSSPASRVDWHVVEELERLGVTVFARGVTCV